MNYSESFKEATKSWGGVCAITLMLILIIFAIFSSGGKKMKMTGNQGKPLELEDIQEQQMKNGGTKNITVKDGQKLVIF